MKEKKLVVTFLKVTDNASKTKRLSDGVNHYFLQGSRVLIVVASDDAARYIDQLLWRLPETGFIPHLISNTPTDASVVITTTRQNLNQAKVLINLTAEPLPISNEFSTIIELLDHTNAEKLQQSKQRQSTYALQGYLIQER